MKTNRIYPGIVIKNFRELVRKYKEEYADITAFEWHNEKKEIVKVSYKKFAEDIENLACSLLNIGAKRVAIISPNRYEWCVSYLAVTTAGLVAVPLDKSLPDNEITGLLKRSKADTIIFEKKYKEAVKDCKNKICMDDDFESYLEKGKGLSHDEYNNIKINIEEMSVMIFTSGTTSISKAVMLSQEAICNNLYNFSMFYRTPKASKYLSFLPLHHTFESTITFLFGTSLGITICFCDGLKHIGDNLVEFKIDGFVCVPLMLEVMYKKILKNIEKRGKTKQVNFLRKVFRHFPMCIKRKVFKSIIDGLGGNLKNIVAGGAAMDKETLQGYNDFGFDIIQGYGLTETASAISVENTKYKKVGSVGLALATNTIKIDNPDADGIGEIITKASSVMLGYYENKEATKEVLKDGWFYTGDLGYIDDEGFLFITGRKKDMIVMKNGKKVFPEEVESIINDLDYVAESFVFGYVDDSKNARNADINLCAEIVLNPTAKMQEEDVWNDIKEKVNKQMPAYKYIRKIIVTKEPLIKTTTLKIKRMDERKKIGFEN